jgi:hypothetical protein
VAVLVVGPPTADRCVVMGGCEGDGKDFLLGTVIGNLANNPTSIASMEIRNGIVTNQSTKPTTTLKLKLGEASLSAVPTRQ